MRAVCVFHYHYRPSGVRTVLERTLPKLLKQVLQTDRVVFFTGEAPDPEWAAKMTAQLSPRKVAFEVVPGLGYLAELGSPTTGHRQQLKENLHRLFLRHRPKLVWAHNLSVGRNPVAAALLDQACKMHGSVLFCHHHDWWPEVRWERFQEMQAWGITSQEEVSASTCPDGPHVRHAVVHPRDAAVVASHVGMRSMWLPNLGPNAQFIPTEADLQRGRAALASLPPYWLMPTRLLGRKNPLEALLLAKMLGAKHFAILGGASSPRETFFSTLLEKAAETLGLKVTINLAGTTGLSPAVLMALAQGCVQSSLIEGWGIPGGEAAVLQKPYILRQLPNLESVQTPFAYQELILPDPPDTEEKRRKEAASSTAAGYLPSWWKEIYESAFEEAETPWFSHLSPLGQLSYIESLAKNGHEALIERNPWLGEWKTMLADTPELAVPKQDENPMNEEEIWFSRFQQVLEAEAPQGNSEYLLSDVFSRCLSAAKAWPWLVNGPAVPLAT